MSTQPHASASDSNADDPSRAPDSEADDGEDEATEGRTMTQEEWIQAMNRANPLDRHLMEKKEFEKQEPLKEAIKLLREGRVRYLLNFSAVDITRLRYRKRPGHRQKDVSRGPHTLELEDLPARSYVAIDDGFDPNVDTSTFALVEAAWVDGSSFQGARALREYNPITGTALRALDLTAVDREVKPVGNAS